MKHNLQMIVSVVSKLKNKLPFFTNIEKLTWDSRKRQKQSYSNN